MGAKQCTGYDRSDDKRGILPGFAGKHFEDTGHFGWCALALQLTLISFYCLTDYEFGSQTVFDGTTATEVLLGVLVFVTVGFGFAGTWMKAYGIGAFGFSLMLLVYTLQEAMLVEGWMREETMHLRLCVTNVITAMMGVVAILISWGAVAGKISPVCMLFIGACEIAVYYANKIYILEDTFQVFDIGGAISIHVFGAFFGVAVSLGMSLEPVAALHDSSYVADVFSNIGTAFMWVYFPNFVSSNAQMNTAAQRTAMLNTLFALLGSTGTAFATGPLFNPEGNVLTPVMLRTSTLAGGVAISCIASEPLGPGGALLVGTLGGMTSSWLVHLRFNSRRPVVEKLENADTFGVMYMSGIPGLLSAGISMVLPVIMKNAAIVWMDQLLGVLTTISVSCISGFIVGRFMKCSPALFPTPELDYNDSTYWKTTSDIPHKGFFEGN